LIIGRWRRHGIDVANRSSRRYFPVDPQLLSFLDPQKHDFRFEIRPADYSGDGTSFQKLAFKDIGEIDFIVGPALTSMPTNQILVQGESVLLETIPEIIAKKIHHRGASIKPRDIFDLLRRENTTPIPLLKNYGATVMRWCEHSSRWTNSTRNL
jgi:hypothetical protein